MQPAQSQQTGDLARSLVGMIGVGEDPVGQQPERATEASARTASGVSSTAAR